MTYVITSRCVGQKETACVEVCPVDAIHPAPHEAGHAEAEQLFIDPGTCIDCDACRNACPVQAIFPEASLPEPDWQSASINREHFQSQP